MAKIKKELKKEMEKDCLNNTEPVLILPDRKCNISKWQRITFLTRTHVSVSLKDSKMLHKTLKTTQMQSSKVRH